VDATVSAHLKTFDISDDLSIDVKPSFTPNYNTSGITGGISLVFNIGKNNSKQLPSPPK